MKKKCGPNFARFTPVNVAWVPPVSTSRSSKVRDHPAVAATRRTVREKAIASLGAAPRRDGDLVDPEVARLLGEDGAEIHHHSPGHAEAHRDFRTHFIT